MSYKDHFMLEENISEKPESEEIRAREPKLRKGIITANHSKHVILRKTPNKGSNFGRLVTVGDTVSILGKVNEYYKVVLSESNDVFYAHQDFCKECN